MTYVLIWKNQKQLIQFTTQPNSEFMVIGDMIMSLRVKSVGSFRVSQIHLMGKLLLDPHKILIVGGPTTNPDAISKTPKVQDLPNSLPLQYWDRQIYSQLHPSRFLRYYSTENQRSWPCTRPEVPLQRMQHSKRSRKQVDNENGFHVWHFGPQRKE